MNALREVKNGALLAGLAALLALLPAWAWAGAWYQAYLVEQARAHAAVEITARGNALTSALNQRIALLQGLYAFTRTEWPDTVFDLPFEIYCSGVYFNATGVRTLLIAPEGITRYVFPLADSSALSGYDLLNDPDPAIRAGVQRAIHTREIVLSRPGRLRQDGFGVTAWQAVYRGKDLWGLVSIAVDMERVLADTGLASSAGGLELSLRDSADSAGRPFFGAAEVWQRSPVIQQILLPDGAWELGGAPVNGWEAAVRGQARGFRWGGLVIVGLAAALVFLTVNRYEQAGQLAVLQERQRLARELHDSVSQVLYSIGLGARTARAALERNPAQTADALEYVNRLAEGGQVEMRALIFELRPESLRADGLAAALEKQADVLRARHQIDTQVHLCPEPDISTADKEILYRVSQEAVHNIIKHARATRVTLTLTCQAGQVCLEVRDNGAGFDPAARFPGRLGLRSMRERALKRGAKLRIDSAPGQGTRVLFTLRPRR